MKMRQLFLITLVVCLTGAGAAWAGHHHTDYDGFHLDFEGGTLIVENGHGHQETVEITADLELYVDGVKISTDGRERRLLKAYYGKAEDVEEAAEELGAEGVRLGARGAALGIKALGGVIHLLDEDFDAEDLEEEIEDEARRIELAAEGIEEAAEALEEWIDELEEIGDELQERIPELEDLDWF